MCVRGVCVMYMDRHLPSLFGGKRASSWVSSQVLPACQAGGETWERLTWADLEGIDPEALPEI